MIFSKIASDISEIAGDLAISEQSVKKIIIVNTSLNYKDVTFCQGDYYYSSVLTEFEESYARP
jgi:hypothetical protein